MTDPTFNLYSPTAAEMKGEFQQMYFDNKIAIGSGRESMDSLDAWIAEWRQRGGEQILAEYQEAYEQANSIRAVPLRWQTLRGGDLPPVQESSADQS